MTWSWTLGRIAGIKVRMHWTFLLLLAWVGFSYAAAGGWPAAIKGIAFILAVFGCVVLHEFGHALTAARFGVPTEDITLLPIGGVARLQRMPREPMHEMLVAIAGPAVNVVIAAVLFAGLLVANGVSIATRLPAWGTSFFINLLVVNVILVAFNALPAFPMDGGRVLRALLATRIEYARATRIAASIGQGMAILFGIAGLFMQPMNPFLVFIALFVYLGAEAEARMVEMQMSLEGLHVRDAMMTQFQTLSPDDRLEQAVDALLAGAQQDFPVLDGTDFRGVLSRQNLVKGLRESGCDAHVVEWISQNGRPAQACDPLADTLEAMRGNGANALPVFDDGRLVGLLSLENISELVIVRSAAAEKSPRSPQPLTAP